MQLVHVAAHKWNYYKSTSACKLYTSGDEDLLIRAFVVYVCRIVEYNSIIWSPYSKHGIDTVEKVQVQRRFTKRLRSLNIYHMMNG